MSQETENPTPPKREAPSHPVTTVEACFRDDDCQRPFINRDRIVEAAKQWAELREAVATLIQEKAWYRRGIKTIRDENADLQRIIEIRDLEITRLLELLAAAEAARR